MAPESCDMHVLARIIFPWISGFHKYLDSTRVTTAGVTVATESWDLYVIARIFGDWHNDSNPLFLGYMCIGRTTLTLAGSA